MAAEFGVAISTISRWLREAGLVTRPRGRPKQAQREDGKEVIMTMRYWDTGDEEDYGRRQRPNRTTTNDDNEKTEEKD